MQPLGMKDDHVAAYHRRLFSSHDYRIDVHVLDLDERPKGTVTLLDGQIDLQDTSAVVRRTATLTVSDIHGALDFTEGSRWSGSTVWVDRLVQIQHTIHVPEIGRDVTVTPFIGPPSAIRRNGAEVSIELQDKTALAIRGSSPLTVHKGMNAVKAIRKILADCTGEFRFRLGTHKRRLGDNYSVGWADESSPWLVASKIAKQELGMQLIYSCDGYATLRNLPSGHAFTVPHVTSQPQDSVDFTTLVNWVRVSGKKTEKTKGNTTTTTQPVATAILSSGNTTPAALKRKGVPRYLPLLVDMSGATKITQVKARADEEIDKASRVKATPSFSCVPFFHADVDDLLHFAVPGGDVTRRLNTGSIPLGVESDMTIGAIAPVSRPPRDKVRGHKVHTVHVRHPKHHAKKGKK